MRSTVGMGGGKKVGGAEAGSRLYCQPDACAAAVWSLPEGGAFKKIGAEN